MSDGGYPLVMVIDDEPEIHKLLKRVIRGAGWDYVGAEDGLQGLKLAAEMQPDLVLLDVNMPSLDGRDVLAKMRVDRMLRHIPVVVITGQADQLSRIVVLEAGAAECIEKPFDAEMLVRRIGWMLEKLRRERAQAAV